MNTIHKENQRITSQSIRIIIILMMGVLAVNTAVSVVAQDKKITFEYLLNEMIDRTVVTQRPVYKYRSLQNSSYNRASIDSTEQIGWFANGDQGFDLGKEVNQGRTESVLMHCDGPGVLTRIWTPFFYKDFNNRKGPDILIYLDGDTVPTLKTNFIELVTGNASVQPPFAQYTCRAGNLFLPIPFSKGCKVTIEGDSFFYIINYRAYEKGTKVESFRPEFLVKYQSLLSKTGKELLTPSNYSKGKQVSFSKEIKSKQHETLLLPKGAAAIRNIQFKLNAVNLPQAMRSTVLEIVFDNQSTVWCPLGDFFGNVNAIDPYQTWERSVEEDGTLICRWIMPYKEKALIRIHNLAETAVSLELQAVVSSWKWENDSYYFHANWWTDSPYPANPIRDMNFIDVRGEGIHVGDNFAVLNPLPWWWGEGDEKIFVDEDFDKHFPSHFGTGTEDYYGWAGGVHPTRADEFSIPFLANIRVGGETRGFDGENPHTRGYNICTRSRSLDATPFEKRFKFDMEAFNFSSGPEAILQYALTTFWYGAPGATHNKPPMVDAATAPVPQIEDLIRASQSAIFYQKGAIEFEDIHPIDVSPTLLSEVQQMDNEKRICKWSMGKQLLVKSNKAGDFATFKLVEQYHPKNLILYITKGEHYGKVNIYVNNTCVCTDWDGQGASLENSVLDLGIHQPINNSFEIKIENTGKNIDGKYIGLDCIILK